MNNSDKIKNLAPGYYWMRNPTRIPGEFFVRMVKIVEGDGLSKPKGKYVKFDTREDFMTPEYFADHEYWGEINFCAAPPPNWN